MESEHNEDYALETTGNQTTELSSKDVRSPLSERTDAPTAIFVYSGFRAGSTWFWSKLRKFDTLRCYYEPFNEQLAFLTPESVDEASPEAWRSHHPAGAPYMREYEPLLSDRPGVRNFPAGDRLTVRYIDKAGMEGPLDEDLHSYIKTLVGAAHEEGRVPVLACTRLLGRSAGIRQAFQGFHVLLVRNLFQQWNSYAGQARFENFYFLSTLFDSLALADRDEFIRYLSNLLWDKPFNTLADWIERDNFDRAFCYFVGFHLYFLLHARRGADLTIDINALTREKSTVLPAVEAALFEHVGIKLDLSDARENVDYPLHPLLAPEDCAATIRHIADHIRTTYAASPEEQLFVDGLVTDLLAEQERYRICISGADEFIALLERRLAQAADGEQRLAAALTQSAALEGELRQIERHGAAALHKAESRQHELAAELRQLKEENLTHLGELAATHEALERRKNEIAEAESQIDKLTSTIAQQVQQLKIGLEQEAILKLQFAQAYSTANRFETLHRDVSSQLSETRRKLEFESRQRRRLSKMLHAFRRDQRGRRAIAWLVEILTKRSSFWFALSTAQKRKRLSHLLDQREITSPVPVDPLVDAILQAVKSGRFG